MPDKTTLLRIKGSKESRPFEAAHAKALLAYPNTQWEEVADKETATKAKDTPTKAADATGMATSV